MTRRRPAAAPISRRRFTALGIGAALAAAAGIVAGEAARGLEVIADVSPADVEKVVAYLEGTPIAVERADSGLDFDIVVQVFAGDGAEGAARPRA